VIAFDTVTNSWQMPPQQMNQPRHSHSSCALGDRVYVFGGSDGHAKLDSVESFDVKQNEWSLFSVEGFTSRIFPVVCPISPTEIVIMGG